MLPDDVYSFCDCHTHLVLPGSREQEFSDKIRGLTYREDDCSTRRRNHQLKRRLLQNTTEDELFLRRWERQELIRFGTGAVEIKSGYGLTVEDELKMLRVIRRIAEETPLTVNYIFGRSCVPEESIKAGRMNTRSDSERNSAGWPGKTWLSM